MNDQQLTMEIFAMQNAFEACTAEVDKLGNTYAKLSVVCILIDHICETYHMDKMKTVDEIKEFIRQVNEEFGSLYPEGESNVVEFRNK